MKKFLLFSLLVLLTAALNAQPFQWQYQEDVYTDYRSHGVVVDNDGKLWIGIYDYADTLSNGAVACGIRVYNADGSEASFSPITTLTIDGVVDTLKTQPGIGGETRRNTGISLDHNGNILVCNGNLYRINASDGTGMNKHIWNAVPNSSLAKATADANGFIYLTKTVPNGGPIEILDENFDLYSFAVDSNFVISRSLAVSPDGKDLYHGGIYPAAGAIHYHSDDGPDGIYTVVDTLWGANPFYELWGQILNWDPAGNLWVGSYWDTAPLAYRGWYSIDPDNNFAFADSIGAQAGGPGITPVPNPAGGIFYAPRGIAFRKDPATTNGWYAFTADFDGYSVKQWWNANPGWPSSGIIQVADGDMIGIKDFELSQNYPNPFNPSTSIPFVLAKAGQVELKIYNVQGQLVTTLVKERMSAGSYKYEFNGTGLASGIYFYQLLVDGKVQSKRMTLTK
ncbi:MAG: T9SS type A sorting domain-containing protein [Calditrichaeota bacterium]|nr:T9SS type A sorting domain-containing protein [Calditrichota bacterium]